MNRSDIDVAAPAYLCIEQTPALVRLRVPALVIGRGGSHPRWSGGMRMMRDRRARTTVIVKWALVRIMI